MEKLYDNIRKIRLIKGFSQQNMADELNLSQRHYGRIEAGAVDISFSLICKIADILGVKVNSLIGLEEVNIFNSYNQPQKVGHFNAYNSTDIEDVTKLYERLIKEKDELIKSYKLIIDLKDSKKAFDEGKEIN